MPEPLERGVARLAHVFGPAVDADGPAVLGPGGLEVSRDVPPTTEPPVGLRTALLCAPL
jgi:hypothetical protein